MLQLNNPMEILKILDKSNCGKCRVPTCLAFAAAVSRGQKRLEECPHIEKDILQQCGGNIDTPKPMEEDREEMERKLKRKISTLDLARTAQRLGAEYAHGRITLRVCGKNFSVDSRGNCSSEIHIHTWITIPVFNYIIDGGGCPVSGEWVPFRELDGGKIWYRLFGQMCENPLKKVADTYSDLFEDMLRIFHGKHADSNYDSDISIVLHPLPRVPILICYWRPDDGLESSLNLFFDSRAEENLNIESIYSLGTGLVRMFEKIALRHGIS